MSKPAATAAAAVATSKLNTALKICTCSIHTAVPQAGWQPDAAAVRVLILTVKSVAQTALLISTRTYIRVARTRVSSTYKMSAHCRCFLLASNVWSDVKPCESSNLLNLDLQVLVATRYLLLYEEF